MNEIDLSHVTKQTKRYLVEDNAHIYMDLLCLYERKEKSNKMHK